MQHALDEELLAGVRRGTPDWEAIYRTYRGVMWDAAARVLRSAERAYRGVSVEDVVHASVAELTARGLATDLRSIPRFLATVAARRALDALRADTDRPSSEVDGPAEGSSEDPVEQAVFDALLADRVARMLSDLPGRERAAVEGRVLHGRPAREVAAELGVTPQRVSQLAAAGLRRLKAAMSQQEDGT